MKYYIIAGEASGDLHGANLMKSLKALDPQAEFRFWGGDKMLSHSPNIVKHYRESSIMGFFEVLKNLRKILSFISLAKRDVLNYSPDVLILIDYPGFNLKVASFAKKKGIKTFYFIAPKTWAWKERRVHKLRKSIDKLFVLFHFEVEYFKKWGIKETYYFGNPIVDEVLLRKEGITPTLAFKERLTIPLDKDIIAILPGSRKSEIEKILKHVLPVTTNFSNYVFVITAVDTIEHSLYEKMVDTYPNTFIVTNETYSALNSSIAAIVTSGTATLETAYLNIPQVVVFRGSAISIFIARLIVKLRLFSLVNILLQKESVTELLQEGVNKENLTKELNKIILDTKNRERMLQDYSLLRSELGEPQAIDRIASAVVESL